MADAKISALVDGTTPDDADDFVVARAGSTLKLTWAALKAAIGGSTPDIQLATTPLTSAQILALGTVAVPVTPTPSANQGQMVLQVWSVYHFVTTAYDGSDVLRITPNYRGGNAFGVSTGSALHYGFDATVWWDQSGKYSAAASEYDHTDLVGSPWSVMCDDNAAPPILGDGTLKVYCVYASFAVP